MSELPASAVLWQQTLQKLAKAPYHLFQRRNDSSNDFAGVFQELIADYVRAESLVEITGEATRHTECALAVRLTEERAEFWRTNLLAIFEAWTGCRGEGLPTPTAGWQLKETHPPGWVRLTRAGDWTLVARGLGELPLHEEYLRRIKRHGSPVASPTTDWMEVTLDCANLPPPYASNRFIHPLLRSIASAQLSLGGRDEKLRLSGKFSFREPLPSPAGPWLIPTNLVREPIIGFTAVRGLAPILGSFHDSLGMKAGAPPNQLFLWAGADFPVQTLAAAPMTEAEAYLKDLAPRLTDRFHPALEAAEAGTILLTTNASGVQTIRWTGVPPWVTPFISSAADAGAQFLIAGTYPNWPGTNPPPLLFHYLISRTNLIYYDWEITAARAQSWRALLNVFLHFFEKPRLGPEAASIAWLNAVSNRLGNTITEVVQPDSEHLVLERQGPFGLTSIEMLGLAHWLESTNFPLNGFQDSSPPPPARDQ